MKYTFQIFTEGLKRAIEPLDWRLTLECVSPDVARQFLATLKAREGAHSAILLSEDGYVAERWFHLDGTWRRKPLGRLAGGRSVQPATAGPALAEPGTRPCAAAPDEVSNQGAAHSGPETTSTLDPGA